MKKTNISIFILILLTISSCYDDKGNYNYEEIPLITIENIGASYSRLRNADILSITPHITSSIEGEITPDNPNFEYSCRLGNASGGQFSDGSWWHIINPDSTQAFTYLPTENTGNYIAIYTVRDKRSDVATNYEFNLEITSSTYEGWMVLCSEGTDNRIRLDMVSVLSPERIEPLYDLLGNNSLITSLHNPTQIMLDRSRYANRGDAIYLLSEEGAYRLDAEELSTDETGNLLESEFLADLQGDIPVRISTVSYGAGVYNTTSAYLAVTRDGNLYCRKVATSGACYEFPINVSSEGNDPEYIVSPRVASGKNRPGDTSAALLYDMTNKRFMGWDEERNDGTVCFELTADANALFPYNTGKEFVYMEGTHFANNTVFTILQDGSGARSVYGINLSNSQFTQQSYIENIQAENFNQATSFAFHSQYPYMFYAYQDKLYTYNLGTQSLQQIITLPGEEITMVKFDLFKSPNPLDIPENMQAQQYYLLVGSYNGSNNGGTLRMYHFNNTTNQLEIIENRTYEGFGRIVDVTYRERFTMTVPS